VIDAPARSRMIYAFGSGERSDVVFVSSLSGNNAEVIKAARIALVEPFLIAK
jgi:DNA-binding MurR/RpiR family transcriptional regulator